MINCDAPKEVKDVFEKSFNLSKKIKRTMNDKAKIEQLLSLKEDADEINIITNEYEQLSESVKKSQNWISKVEIIEDGEERPV